MKRLFLIKNPELFQGKTKIENNKIYFEGWYFKISNNTFNISFIPGININEKEKKAFIQIITPNNSYFINYNFKDFTYSHNPFYIKIGNNYFSKEKIHIDINDNKQKINLSGDIKYSNSKNINTNLLNPNIMGPFAYIPFMECNHAIINMKSKVNGIININNDKIIFNDDIGYIEKDWGTSFPKTYIWCQGNNFKNSNASFMLSIANIPFKILTFRGLISTLIINDKEYRFATYNNAKIIKYDITDKFLNIVLKKSGYTLQIKSNITNGYKLLAPIKGKMEKNIIESITENITVTLKKKDKVIFLDTSTNCGLEIVNK